MALLIACFDESGTHDQYGHQVTLVSGLIGSESEWNLMNTAWSRAMGRKTFHYKDFRLEADLLNQLAEIVVASA